MSDLHDPDHGELHCLFERLDAPQAEMIQGDLRDLNIPAVLKPHRSKLIDLETDEDVWVDTDEFKIMVPEAFLKIASEVLNATHLQSEGPTSEAEILAELGGGSAARAEKASTDRANPKEAPVAPIVPVRPSIVMRIGIVILVAAAAIVIGTLLGRLK